MDTYVDVIDCTKMCLILMYLHLLTDLATQKSSC